MRLVLSLVMLLLVGCNLNSAELASRTDSPTQADTTQNIAQVSTAPPTDVPTSTPTLLQSIPTVLPTPTRSATPISQATETPTVIEGAIGPFEYADNINPLTGLPVDNPETLNRRPIVVKVSNSPALVRPQAGIGSADLVFEHYTEVGITRFSAIFYGQAPTRVGSIRSARLIDYELVPMYAGLLAFSGGSIGVEKRIFGSEVVGAFLCQNREDYDQCLVEASLHAPAGDVPPSEFAERAYKGVLIGRPTFFRDEAIPVPHNMFVNVEALWGLAESDGHAQRPNLRGMAFHPEPPPNPTGTGTRLEVRYETTIAVWDYQPETGKYLRSTDGQGHFDANTGEQVSADNVIVVYAGHYLTDIIESQFQDTIHWSAQITVWPQGEMVLLRDGLRYEGQWLRPSRPDLMRFQTQEGDILYLKPGNTWFQLVRLPDQMNPEREWVRVE